MNAEDFLKDVIFGGDTYFDFVDEGVGTPVLIVDGHMKLTPKQAKWLDEFLDRIDADGEE